jgi:hypothetical protein
MCEDNAANCSGCGLDEFKSQAPAPPPPMEEPEQLVTLATCEKLADADLMVSKLDSAGIEAFIPDAMLMQAIGFNLNTYGFVRVQVRAQDLASARAVIAPPKAATAGLSISTSAGLKSIALLQSSQTNEILDLLKQHAIPAEIHSIAQPSGLEMSEIMVEDKVYARGCELVEAWYDEKLANQKKRSTGL